MVDEGVSLVDVVGGSQPDWQQPDWWLWNDSEKKSLMPGGAEVRFYNDVSDKKVLDDLIKRLEPHAVGTFYSKNTYAAWKDVPATYVACSKDNAIPIEGQKAMVELANAVLNEGGKQRQVKEVVLESSHSPMISMPERLAEEVRKVLEA